MIKSDSIAELAKALVKVQAELKPAVKAADNPFYKSKYADLTAIWDACRASLAKHGLAVVQTTDICGPDEVAIETTLIHTSGEYVGGILELPVSKHDAQGVGSAITYGRRYGLAALVGIVADEDDDGNRAVESVEKATKARRGKMVRRIRDLEKELEIDEADVDKLDDGALEGYGKELAKRVKELDS